MKCPGQDSRFWQPGAIFESQCPNCGQAVEFFKDESTRRCKQCGHKFVNPKMDFGCASYCKFAEQCLGELTPELLAKREDLLKDRVAIEMKKYFQKDFKRIAHASKVARYAEEIVKAEQGDPSVVLCAAYLHDIGAREALRKHQSTDAHFQEQEGPEVAREILARLGARAELITEVCDIIGHHHHPRDSETTNFKAVFDADYLANLEEKGQASANDAGVSPEVVNGAFLTDSGRALAKNVLKFPNP
jgi:HD superfamily phosphodiesterase